ncbi:MAG: flagellar biosynthesis anti-sigma factor FlgM [Bacteroidales bacterium]|nr:flagellar biosynthesis anti-sigma factor FlgM [Clostridium sp.]MCM1203823.1 flagellar biosynthesis anti-sigma factor FlgM [Bacteroidales bacterium]
MRISSYNQVAQVYGSQSVKKSYKANSVNATSSLDKISFSTVGKDIQVAKNALNEVPDVREDKVRELKERMANGTYQVSAESFADKLMAAFDEKSV